MVVVDRDEFGEAYERNRAEMRERSTGDADPAEFLDRQLGAWDWGLDVRTGGSSTSIPVARWRLARQQSRRLPMSTMITEKTTASVSSAYGDGERR
jgi:hypothetical protein